MAETALVDSGFVVAILRQRDTHRDWAASQASRFAPPWNTCEAVLSEVFHLLDSSGAAGLIALLRRRAVVVSFEFAREQASVLALMQKYSDVPMSLADACLVRMTEVLADPVILTTDTDFRIYRRHGRQAVPCVMPHQG
jgi:predicted nucleic acid-binding protein